MSFKKTTDQLQRSLFAFCKEYGVLPSEVELVTNDVEMTAYFRIKPEVINQRTAQAKAVIDRAINNLTEEMQECWKKR